MIRSAEPYISLIRSVSTQEKEYGPMGTFICSCHYENIGPYVEEAYRLDESYVTTALSVCRRRFKSEELVLIDVLDEDEEGEKGLAFTETAAYYWDEEFQFSFAYTDMREVDYDDNDMEVVVVVEDGSRYVIECTGDEEQRYQRYLYNFLMDIKEKAEEGFAEVIDK